MLIAAAILVLMHDYTFKTNFHHLHQILIFITKLTNIRWCPLAPPMLIAAVILVLMHDYTYTAAH